MKLVDLESAPCSARLSGPEFQTEPFPAELRDFLHTKQQATVPALVLWFVTCQLFHLGMNECKITKIGNNGLASHLEKEINHPLKKNLMLYPAPIGSPHYTTTL